MIAILAYLFAMVAANLSVATFGPWISPLNAFFLIGLDLSLRDHLHDKWRGRSLWPRMGALIATAGALSYALNPAAGRIALASVVAFCCAAIVDAATYHILRNRLYLQRSNGSNLAGAAVDSILFPTMAFGAVLPAIITVQFAAKVSGGFIWSIIFNKINIRHGEGL